MTNEEAIAYGKRVIGLGLNDETQAFCELAIKALEQEPCDDCISRQSVEEMIKAEMPERDMWEIEGDKEKETVCEVCVDLMQKLSDLPPITQQPKIGRWMSHYDYCKKHELLPSGLCAFWWCDLCEQGVEHPTNFCPNCGAKMEDDI